MRLFLTAASMLALATAPASADEARSFDIWQSTDAGKSVIALAAIGDKAPFAAAGGTEKTALDLLPADEASALIADLRARAAAKVEIAEKAVAEEGAATKVVEIEKTDDHSGHSKDHHAAMSHEGHGDKASLASTDEPHKIVLVKEVKDGATEKKEVRRIIKLNGDKDMTDAELATLLEQAKAELKAEGGDLALEHGALAPDDADAALLASIGTGKVLVVENMKDGAATRLVSIAGADAESARAFIAKAEGLDDAEKAKLKADLGL